MRLASCLVLASALVVGAMPATAGKKAGVTMPDTIKVADKTLTLNGMGVREATIFKVDVYVAGLYLETVSSDPATILAAKETKVLVLRFVRDVDRSDIVEAWSSGFKKNATVKLSTLQPQIDILNKWMGSFEDGDTLTFTYVPGTGLDIQVGTTRKGVINNDDFARSLFSIWLGPRPPNGGLKKGLLGKH